MNEEERQRIEMGDPTPVGEIVIGLTFFLGIVGLIVSIVLGVI